MRRYFLSYANITKDYYLDYGCFERNRENLGKVNPEKLIESLNDILQLHRKTIIYVQKSLKENLKEILDNSFKNTSVNIQFERNLESLC